MNIIVGVLGSFICTVALIVVLWVLGYDFNRTR